MKDDAAKGKILGHKGQKDFLKSVLADSDDEVDMDTETAEALVESQLSYVEELKKKFKRKRSGKTDSTDADFEAPTMDELNEMLQQTMKLRKQKHLAELADEDNAEFDKNDTTNGTRKAGALTAEERKAKKAKKAKAIAAKKKEMAMLRDLQSVQGTALLDQMKAGGKKTAVAEQAYGDTYMKTTAIDADSVDEQMFDDGTGSKKMRIGKGASATEKPVNAKPATTTKATGNKTRLLQDAATTKATPAAANSTAWKDLKNEEDFMKVEIDKKMFEKGGPLFGIKKPIIMFNKHGGDYVKDFPRAKKDSFDSATGKKKAAANKTKAAVPANATTVDEDDDQLNDTVAQQVLELEFLDGENMAKIPIKNLTKGMLKICMMMKNKNQKLQYVNEDNEQFQDDGISQASLKQQSTKDDTNQKERKGY